MPCWIHISSHFATADCCNAFDLASFQSCRNSLRLACRRRDTVGTMGSIVRYCSLWGGQARHWKTVQKLHTVTDSNDVQYTSSYFIYLHLVCKDSGNGWINFSPPHSWSSSWMSSCNTCATARATFWRVKLIFCKHVSKTGNGCERHLCG